jgi:hypothetical protein
MNLDKLKTFARFTCKTALFLNILLALFFLFFAILAGSALHSPSEPAGTIYDFWRILFSFFSCLAWATIFTKLVKLKIDFKTFKSLPKYFFVAALFDFMNIFLKIQAFKPGGEKLHNIYLSLVFEEGVLNYILPKSIGFTSVMIGVGCYFFAKILEERDTYKHEAELTI